MLPLLSKFWTHEELCILGDTVLQVGSGPWISLISNARHMKEENLPKNLHGKPIYSLNYGKEGEQ